MHRLVTQHHDPKLFAECVIFHLFRLNVIVKKFVCLLIARYWLYYCINFYFFPPIRF